jgi:hypothetical protein
MVFGPNGNSSPDRFILPLKQGVAGAGWDHGFNTIVVCELYLAKRKGKRRRRWDTKEMSLPLCHYSQSTFFLFREWTMIFLPPNWHNSKLEGFEAINLVCIHVYQPWASCSDF